MASFKSRLVILAACVCLVCGCGPDKKFSLSAKGRLFAVAPPSAKDLAKMKLQYYWTDSVELAVGESLRRMWRLDEKLYLLTSNNRLVALEAATGAFAWSCQVADVKKDVFAPCHAGGVAIPKVGGMDVLREGARPDEMESFDAVIVNTLGYALLIDRKTGKVKRKLEFEFAANSPGCSDGFHFYVGSVRGWFYAVRLSEGLVTWTMTTKDMITTAPRYAKGVLYVASNDGSFYAARPNLGRERRRFWQQVTDGPLTAGFVVAQVEEGQGACFVPSGDYRLYAYNSVTGKTLWTFRAQGPLLKAVQVGVRSVFQYAYRDKFYALDLATGRERWQMPHGRLVLGAAGAYVFVLSDKRQMLAVHEVLGDVEHSVFMSGLELFVPNAADSVLYAASRSGGIACIRPIGAGHLTPAKLKARRDQDETGAGP